MKLTADKAFKESQKGVIREEKKNKKRNKKEFRLVMRTIRKATRRGETEYDFWTISPVTICKLKKLGYKIKYHCSAVEVDWENAGTSVTGREGEVSA